MYATPKVNATVKSMSEIAEEKGNLRTVIRKGLTAESNNDYATAYNFYKEARNRVSPFIALKAFADERMRLIERWYYNSLTREQLAYSRSIRKFR